MNWRSTFILGVCMLVSILAIIGLRLMSTEVRNTKGSFLRSFRQHAINERLDLNLKINSYYLAGATRSNIFLGNYLSPLNALSINIKSGDTTHFIMHVDGIFDQKFWSVQLKVDSPNFYMYDGVIPRIYKGNIDDWTAVRFKYDEEYFQDFEPISSNSFAIKSLLGEKRDAALGKISNTPPYYNFRPTLLQKQVDGFFCTDGHLKYNKHMNRLIYLYRYRNEYLIMDSSFNLLNKSTTIDTNSVAKIEVVNIHSTGSRVFQTPPLVVNDKCSVYGNYLFVNSAILSNNESADALEDASVIDVYNLVTYKYLFSFYIFDHHTGEKLREFKVTENGLVALFGTYIQVFAFSKAYFPGIDQ